MKITFPFYSRELKRDRVATIDLSKELKVSDILETPVFGVLERKAKIVPHSTNAGYKIELLDKNDKGKGRWNYVIGVTLPDGSEVAIKSGKVKDDLDKRTYTAGTEKNWKKGTASISNYINSQIFRKCLELELDVYFYAYQVPGYKATVDVYGKTMEVVLNPYEDYEHVLNNLLKTKLGRHPCATSYDFELLYVTNE